MALTFDHFDVPVFGNRELFNIETLRIVVRTNRVYKKTGSNQIPFGDVAGADDVLRCIRQHRIGVGVEVTNHAVYFCALLHIP